MALVPFPDPSTEEPEDDGSQLDETGDADSTGGKMSFLEHLDELRKRLITAAISLVVGFLIAFAFIGYIFDFIMSGMQEALPARRPARLYRTDRGVLPLHQDGGARRPGHGDTGGPPPSSGCSSRPGSTPARSDSLFRSSSSRRSSSWAARCSPHYMLFPWAWSFFASFSTESDIMQFMPRIQPAFSLYVRLLLACGLVFQMPTLVFFLARVGAVTPGFLARNIKYAILLIFIFAAVLTPTGDPVTLTMMAAPMIVLYGFSIFIAWVFRRRHDDEE